MNIPVLVTAFNRPNETKLALEALSEIRPKKIYFSVDGPRDDRDYLPIQQTLESLNWIHWDCEIKTKINDKNLGLASAVTSAVNWAFETEEILLIIEDDILISKEFVLFAENFISLRSTQETDFFSISASNLIPDNITNCHDFRKSIFFHSWGWMTTQKKWKLFSEAYEKKEYFMSPLNLYKVLQNKFTPTLFFLYIQILLKRNKLNSWAYPLTLYCFKNNYTNIITNNNLAINIGFGPNSTHTKFKHQFIPEESPEKLNKNYKFNSLCPEVDCLNFDKMMIDYYNFGSWTFAFKYLLKKFIAKIFN